MASIRNEIEAGDEDQKITREKKKVSTGKNGTKNCGHTRNVSAEIGYIDEVAEDGFERRH